MSGGYRKCLNPDCEKLCKRHLRCRDCRRSRKYICQICKTDIYSPKAKICPKCSLDKHNEFERNYQKCYRLRKDVEKIISVTDHMVFIPQ